MNTTSNFFEALKLVKVPAKQEIFFRLYYNKQTGEIICYSMEDLDGDYIEITAEEFAMARHNIIVKDGKIKVKNEISIGKLAPSDNGCEVHANDITIMDSTSNRYWSTKTYDTND